MKRWNIAALLLAAIAIPVIGLAYLPFFKEVKRNVAIKQGDEILGRLIWYVNEFQRASPDLDACHVPVEDRGNEVAYRLFPDDSTRFALVIRYTEKDSVVYDSRLGAWK